MPRALSADRDLWGRTLSLLLIGFICYALPLSVFAALPASEGDQPVLRIQGSNTIGAKLGPELVKGLFEAQGLRDIRIEDGAQENEQRIVARQADGRSVIVEVAAHGSSTGFASLQTGSTDLAASSRPIKQIVDDKTAAIYELGLPWLQLSPIGAYDPAEQARFSAGLVDLMQREGLYKEDSRGVRVSEQVLYQARIRLPSSVPVGRYTAETLERLVAIYPGVRFVWLMGADNLGQFHRWERWEDILRMVPVGVLARPGWGVRARMSKAARIYSGDLVDRGEVLRVRHAPAWCFVNLPMDGSSSSEIRARGEWKK